MTPPTIYQYVKAEENKFQSDEIQVGDNWQWNFRHHIQLIFHLKNSQFYSGENNWLRAFKNIMEPILNLSYWAEDIELKDVVFYIENQTGRVLSFLVKKYHDEVFVKEHDLDTLFDEITESDVDYGGTLVQRTDDVRPEVLQLNTVAFCDQTDIMGGPIGFKFYFSPDKLRAMSKVGWGEESNGATMSLDELITLASNDKETSGTNIGMKNETPGKNIEVYIVRGNLPDAYLKDNDNMEDWYNQVHIVAYYHDDKKHEKGVTLYRHKEKEGNIKFHTSKKVHGRALGRGVGESLLHPQVWSNFVTIHKMSMLEAASKVPLWTDDENYVNRNQIQDMENLQVTTVAQGRHISQVPTAAPANLQLMEGAINEWYEQAQLAGSAFDPILGKDPASGTTFRGQERTVAQGRGLHDRRRGQRAKFIEQIYREWIIPEIRKQILKGKKFLATLTIDEMAWVADRLAENYATRNQIESILSLEVPKDAELLKQEFKARFSKNGTKHLIEILKDEFKDVEIKMGVNIAGKQKDLVNLSDKLLSIFQFAFANPMGFQQVMQIPGMANAFNDILEYSGLSQADFASMVAAPSVQQQQPVPQGAPQPAPTLALPQPAAVNG